MTAQCLHENTETTPRGGTYCLSCGMRMITPPGPVYYDALRDARRRQWLPVQDLLVPLLHKSYIGARYNEETKVWMLGRVMWCDDCGHWEVVQDLSIHARCHSPAHISHVASDTLGTP